MVEPSTISKSHTLVRSVTRTGTAQLVSNIEHMSFNKEEAINKAKYGFTALKHGKKGKPHKRRFYILEDNYQYLQWISHKKKFGQSRLRLTDIKQIEQGNNSVKFNRNKDLADENFSVCLTHKND